MFKTTINENQRRQLIHLIYFIWSGYEALMRSLMKTLSLLLILVIGISLVCLPSHATNANTARVQQLLDQSTASFKQNNYMLGVSQVRQACTLLKQDPAANDGTCTYTDLAAQCINGVKQSIENMHPSNDFAGMAAVTARGSAIQPLLQACMQWEPTNPRWHYESGMIYRLE